MSPGAEAVPDCGGLGNIDVHVDITSETDEGGRTNIGGEEEPLMIPMPSRVKTSW